MPQDQEPARSLPSLRSLVLVTRLTRSNAIRGRQLERRQTIDVPEPEPCLKRSNAIIRRGRNDPDSPRDTAPTNITAEGRCVSFDSPLSPTTTAQEIVLAEPPVQEPLEPQAARLQTLLNLPFRPRQSAFACEFDGEHYPPPPHPTSPDHLRSLTPSHPLTQDPPVDWEEVRRVPQLLTTWAQDGEPASRIGQLLHERAYGRDRSLGNLVTTMVDQRRAYHEIGHAVLRNLDLRNEQGDPLYRDVPLGDVSLTPRSRPQVAVEDVPDAESSGSPLSYEYPHTIGPRMTCPQPRPSQVRWPFFEDEESLEAFLRESQDDDCDSDEGETVQKRPGGIVVPTPYHPPRARQPRYVVPACIPAACAASVVGDSEDEGD